MAKIYGIYSVYICGKNNTSPMLYESNRISVLCAHTSFRKTRTTNTHRSKSKYFIKTKSTNEMNNFIRITVQSIGNRVSYMTCIYGWSHCERNTNVQLFHYPHSTWFYVLVQSLLLVSYTKMSRRKIFVLRMHTALISFEELMCKII